MSWFLLDRNLKLLEPYDWKLSRTVLRGERGSNAPDLPGKAIAKEGMANYIRYLFKTVRKFYGEAVVVTQEVDDIISSPVVKETIINNSDCKILLDQRKYQNKFDQIQNLLGLTD
ncbi:TraG family conjugative transposon ATPase, partial [Bacteroides ovatus]